jgi:hypothetical protein
MAEISEPVFHEAPPRIRPLGVSIIAAFLVMGAVLNALSFPNSFWLLWPLFTGYTVTLAVADTAAAIGLWKLRPWGRKLAIAIYLVQMMMSVLDIYVYGSFYGVPYLQMMLVTSIPAWIVQIIIVVYLTLEHVKMAFEGGGQ